MTLTAYRENKFPLFLNRVYPQSVDVSCDLSSTSPLTRILLRTAAYYHKKLTEFLFVQSGFPLELPFPRFVTSPQLFFRSGIPHHRGFARTFTAVRISRRSYKPAPGRNKFYPARKNKGMALKSEPEPA